MLTSQPTAGQADFAQLVEMLVREQNQFVQNERRSMHRETLVRPAEITQFAHSVDGEDVIYGVTCNISPSGICLLTLEPIQINRGYTVKIHRLHCEPAVMTAECRWCKSFTKVGYMTGWHFRQLMRS